MTKAETKDFPTAPSVSTSLAAATPSSAASPADPVSAAKAVAPNGPAPVTPIMPSIRAGTPIPSPSAPAVNVPMAVKPGVAPLKAVPSSETRLNTILEPASPSRIKRRHYGVLGTFFAFVMAPMFATACYLWFVAADQYSSTVGFSVHREDSRSPLDLIGGLSSISGMSSSDTDIIYKYLYSMQLVAEIDQEIDLRGMWSKPTFDPIFVFDADSSTEDLVDYWGKMVKVYYDGGSHLIEVRSHAFAPEDAQKINETIFAKATMMINRLNDIASQDSVRYARNDLEQARAELISVRQAMTAFRNKYQILDPANDATIQAGLLATLQQELANTLIELDLLKDTSAPNDPRRSTLQSRATVIEARIAAERQKIGFGGAVGDGVVYADVVSEYEKLRSDLEFAEAAHAAARATYEAERSTAARQSRYLAAHITPTLAESSRYPARWTLLSVVGVFVVLAWSIAVLVYYSVRDRR